MHAELKTRTKMFCDSLNDPDERHPNVNVCPVCLGHPGALPTINKQAVEAVIRAGLALGGKINERAKFDRKNYFYPDLPKGYQISQYDEPIVTGGELKGVRVRRIHLEEDTGTLAHFAPSADLRGPDADRRGNFLRESALSQRESASLVDFNRAGVPLLELVTEPDITSAEQAVEFGKALRLIFRYLGISDADMEKGQMRLEANVSLRETADDRGSNADQRGNGLGENLGTKVEIKNINSFKALGVAIAYELKRQEEHLKEGKKIVQETRGWNEDKQATVSQRSKEEAHDYRYFPEPDLPPIRLTNGRASPTDVGGPPSDIAFDIEAIRASLPELPEQKIGRFEREFGISAKQAELLVSDKKVADFFEEAVSELATRDELTTSRIDKKSQEMLFNYITGTARGIYSTMLVQENGAVLGKIKPEHIAHLIDLICDGKIGERQARDILKKMFEDGSDPEEILNREGLHTVSDTEELKLVVEEVIAENPTAAADYKKGKAQSLQFMIGKAMGKLKGRGNPGVLKEIFEQNLSQ